MKRTACLLLIFAGLLGMTIPYAWSAEANMEVPLNRTDPDLFLTSFPFFYSYESGQWISSQPGRIFTTGSETADFELPFLKQMPQPMRYPRWALTQGWQGELVVAIEILENGSVGRWKVMHSIGHRSLDEAAIKAVRAWRFEPGKLRGKAIVSCIQIPIRFRVD